MDFDKLCVYHSTIAKTYMTGTMMARTPSIGTVMVW